MTFYYPPLFKYVYVPIAEVSRTSGTPIQIFHASRTLYAGEGFCGEIRGGTGKYLFGKYVDFQNLLPTASKTVVNPLDASPYDESKLYDNNFATYARPATDIGSYETRVLLIWDLGTSAPRFAIAAMSIGPSEGIGLDGSDDGSTWTTLVGATSPSYSGASVNAIAYCPYRYLRIWAQDRYGAIRNKDEFRFYEVKVTTPTGDAPVFPKYKAPVDETAYYSFAYDGTSTIVYSLFRLQRYEWL